MNVERSALDFSNIRGMREGESVRPTPRSKCIQPMSVMMSRKSATHILCTITIKRFNDSRYVHSSRVSMRFEKQIHVFLFTSIEDAISIRPIPIAFAKKGIAPW
jgi:hypothetical protein